MKLTNNFYQREDVTEVARDLLGKVLHTVVDGEITSGKIVETEAYSYRERACHAFDCKRTKRTETLFMEGGTSYVYLCYGIHNLFNVVTNKEDVAEAVLVRAVEPLEGSAVISRRRNNKPKKEWTSGPGKLANAFGIDLFMDKLSLVESPKIWIEDHKLIVDEIEASPRIGVGYAGEDAKLPWRYTIPDNAFVSKGINTY